MDVRNHLQTIKQGFLHRIVPENLRSFGIGVQWLFFRALGTIPGPIIYAALIDRTCLLWQKRQCDGSIGSCWIYDTRQMALTFMAISIVGNTLSALFFVLSWWFYKPEDSLDANEVDQKENGIIEDSSAAYPNPVYVNE
ncbi:unnamed protein product [Clavelina lepadiformis]|uniref:Solute carrier organic anion transporter family member 4A1 n=1 Tax=Clavelina lepadiformis TaxID=159417 RepID=A0ABP0FBX3_CLALP